MAKNNPLMELGGERSYSNKESSLQDIASEQSLFFAFAVHLGVKACSPRGKKVHNAILGQFRTTVPIYWQANKEAKHPASSRKRSDQNGVLLSNAKDIL